MTPLRFEELLLRFAMLTTTIANAIPITSFYNYGRLAGDSQLGPTDDDPSPPIQLPTAFLYYNTLYSSLFVNNNGILSFTSSFPDFTAQPFPLQSTALVAPYWADVDTRSAGSGLVWYRITLDATLLARAGHDIPKILIDADFIPQWLFIVTWDHVGYYNLNSDKTDTFQCVLTTDGYQSFVMFLYADGLIQWTTGDSSGGSGGLGGITALVGFNSGDGLNYNVVLGSQTAEIKNITLISNVGTPGLFIYRVNDGITSASVTDINYCNKICQQNCTAANGSYYCSCSIGYELTSNQKNCTDINECSTFRAHSPCQQNCTNTNGSFYCSCGIGYGLAIDNRECIDINECLPNGGLGPCEHMCNNINGSFICSCRTGYIIGADQNMCFDINECLQNGGLGPCQQMCTNTNGSFFCSCRAGYMLGFNQSECIVASESTSINQSQSCKNLFKNETMCCSDQFQFLLAGDLCNDTKDSTCLQCPCMNGGLCRVCSYNGSTPSFACQCSFWNTGQFCEHNDGYNLDILLLSTVTPTTVIAVVLCIFATSLLFIFSKRRQRRKGKRKEDSTIHVLDMDIFQNTNELSDAESAQRIHKTEDLESGIHRS